MRIDFINDELFGNEAGEDENRERLAEYYLEKPEYEIFFSNKRHLAFVRARKGVGKSALLSYANYKLEKNSPKSIFIFVKAADLIVLRPSPKSSASALAFSNYWQECLCTRIAIEIGKNITFAGNDDSMTLVETAELTGFKGRNIVSALCDRFKKMIDKLAPEKQTIQNSSEILKRYSLNENINVWFFIDDIDATFINTPENRILVSTFFSACRNIVNTVEGLYIRASVRTDIWAIIKSEDESLDKCEQYMLDLKWSTEDTGHILAKKILAYFLSTYPDDTEIANLKKWYPHSRNKVFNLVFNGFLPWGKRQLEPFRPIHILSAGRPRWAAQLCKMAAHDSYKKNNNKIGIGHIDYVLFDYGKSRLSDLYKEHGHQCQELKHVIESFRNKGKQYTTKELLSFISKIILNPDVIISIDSNVTNNPLDIAHFLYRIGFITLDDDTFENGESFIRFEDLPDLLIPSNLNDRDIWAIHPSYRNVLHLTRN